MPPERPEGRGGIPAPPPPPPVLGPRYALAAVPPLGRGGMGVVYRARDRVLDMDVAVKLIRPDLASDPRLRERLALEVQLAARIPHPRLVPLHDLGTSEDGVPYYVMALAEGGSLAGWRGDWETLRAHLGDVLEALAALHARGVLHRDLKPENVLLHPQGSRTRAWVADLGLAEVADTLAVRASDLSGTPEYMAPEQRAGRTREFGPWTDLYAVGRLLSRLTFGVLSPTGLDEVLAHLLHPEPYARPDSAALVRAMLEGLGAPTVVRRSLAAPARGTGPTLYPSEYFRSSIHPLSPSSATTERDLPPLAEPTLPSVPLPPTVVRVSALPPEPLPEHGRGAVARASLPLLTFREVPLVGREELRRAAWGEARAVLERRAPRVVLLVGEAGAGRSRLASSMAWALEEGGWMEAIRFDHRVPATPEDGYAGAVRRYLRPRGESPGPLEERLLRMFERDFGGEAGTWASRMRRWCGLLLPGEAPVDRSLGLAFLWERLRRTRRGGTCLVLDDAHLADPAEGLSIARNLLDQAAAGDPVPVLVLATLRTDALAGSPALQRQVEGLVEDGAVRLDLPRLDRPGTAALLDELLTLTPDLAELVAARCEGNPLLARLLLTGWAAEGLLVEGGDLAHGLRPGLDVATALPDSTAALFARRLAAAVESAPDPAAVRTALHTLSLVDVPVPEAVLLDVAREHSGLVARTGLLRREGDVFVWDHNLLQDAVRAEAVVRPDLGRLHLRLAEAWGAWGRLSGSVVDDQVGPHLAAGGKGAEALRLLLPACERADRSGRMAALLRLAAAAQEAADAGGAPATGAARLARYLRARGLSVRGELDAAELLLRDADALGSPAASDGLGAAATGGPASALRTLPRDLLPEDLAAPLADVTPTALVDAYGSWARGHLHRLRGRLEEAVLAFRDARDRYRAAGDTARAAYATLQLAGCRRQAHAFDEAEALYRETRDDARATRELRLEAYALREMGVLAAWRGQSDRADELLARCRQLFRASGEVTGEGVAMMRQSQQALKRGQPDLAEGLLREAMHAFVASGTLLEVQNCRNDLADVARSRGDLPAARAGYRAAVRWSEERGWREMMAIGRVNLALVALAADDPVDALREADHLVDALAYTRNHWLRPFAEVVRACAHARLGQGDEASRRLRLARKRGLGAHADRDLAWVLHRLAEAAKDQGWPALAEDAERIAERIG